MSPNKSASVDPQNPYESFIVSASAGSGKTYQLSKRFLHLVAAGAPPSGILTVTFTKKAASEMRARILSEAARLIGDGGFQKEFSARSLLFWEQTCADSSQRIPAPLEAQLVGRSILEQSQLLPIATIDSLLTQWVSKFPMEASATGTCRGKPWHDNAVGELPNPYRLLDPNEAKPFNELAWWAACRVLGILSGAKEPPLEESEHSSPPLKIQDLFTTKSRIEALTHQSTLIWYLEEMFGGGFKHFPTNEEQHGVLVKKLWEVLSQPLLEVAGKVSNPEVRYHIQNSVAEQNWEKLLQSGILTKSSLTISGTYIRGKNRESLVPSILKIENAVKSYINQIRLSHLNETGSQFYQFYRLYQHGRNTLKYQKNLLEFSDLTQGAFRLFHGDHGSGVRYLLSQVIHHVMLDEFQDTSRLQWSIFRELGESLLGTPDLSRKGPHPSIFIVGDPKQSIYGFREADPEVLGEARNNLASYIKEVPLATSYRTSPLVLEFINAVFSSKEKNQDQPLAMAEFPVHQAARDMEGRLLTPHYGGVYLADIPDPEPTIGEKGSRKGSTPFKEEISPPQISEAHVVAQTIKRILDYKSQDLISESDQAFFLPIYDSKFQGYRLPRASDIAILYRSSQEAEDIEAELHRSSILTRKEEEKGFFKRLEITDIMALLRVAISIEDRASLATVLKSPMGRFLTPKLTDTTILKSLWLSKQKKDEMRGTSFLKALCEEDEDFALKLLPKINRLRHRGFSLSPHQFLYETYKSFDIFKIYGGPSENQKIATANLEKLLNLVLKLENQGHRDLISLSVKLERMAHDDLMGIAHQTQDAVTMMTIHKSKGLEFPLVFVVGCQNPWGQRDSHWEPSPSRDGIFYIGTQEDFPIDHPFFDRIRQTSVDRISRECGRLLYVALTRAKQYLFLVGRRPQKPRGLKETVVFPMLEAGLTRLSQYPRNILEPLPTGCNSQSPPRSEVIGLPQKSLLEFDSQAVEIHYVQSIHLLQEKPRMFEFYRTSNDNEEGVPASKPSCLTDIVLTEKKLENTPIQQLVPHGVLIQAPSRHQESGEEDFIRVFRSSHVLQENPGEQKSLGGDHHGPHSAHENGSADVTNPVVPISPRLAKSAGIWLHKGLQCFIEKTPFNPEMWWNTLATPEYRNSGSMEQFKDDLDRCLRDPWLGQLCQSAQFIRCEMPAVFKKNKDIYNCVIDLFLIDQEGTPWVIDYKTTKMNPPSTEKKSDGWDLESFLLDFATSRRWTKQISIYLEALKRIIDRNPEFWRSRGLKGRSIKGCLYFTSLQKSLLCPSISLS
jgi:ATP-dependent helicase/nuclease subunit A